MSLILDAQNAVLALWYVVNCSLSSYYKLTTAFDSAEAALSASAHDWQALGIDHRHLERLSDADKIQAFLTAIADELSKDKYRVILHTDEDYPRLLGELYDPPPVLFYRGEVSRLNDSQVAIVGSRVPSDYAAKVTYDLAQYLVQAGFVITSGLAEGVDTLAHTGALAQYLPEFRGKTVGVMGTGIDVTYPKSNQALFAEIIESGGCLVTEMLPKTRADKYTFPRRNRLVAGLSLATIVTEAALKSGSLITARLTNEQGKQVFAIPNRIDSAAEGCHYLIREGATLVYHPNQIIEDLVSQYQQLSDDGVKNMFGATLQTVSTNKLESAHSARHNLPPKATKQPSTPSTKTQSSAVTVPEHLQTVHAALGDDPIDLDKLVAMTGLPAASLLANLTELEIFGLARQIGGRYAR